MKASLMAIVPEAQAPSNRVAGMFLQPMSSAAKDCTIPWPSEKSPSTLPTNRALISFGFQIRRNDRFHRRFGEELDDRFFRQKGKRSVSDSYDCYFSHRKWSPFNSMTSPDRAAFFSWADWNCCFSLSPADHFAVIRIAPSSRMTSPLSMEFSIICITNWAYSEGLPRRFGKGVIFPRASCASCGRDASIGVAEQTRGNRHHPDAVFRAFPCQR